MIETVLLDFTFLENINQLLLFSGIIVLAGVVRGCIGFGFSAITVASTSFWLPAVAVVNLVVLLEIMASLVMFFTVYRDIKLPLLLPLSAGAILTTFLGTWLLATLSSTALQWLIGVYMVIIASLTLLGYEFKGEATQRRILGIGVVAGFFNGLAAVGGIFAAWGLVGLKQSVREIRATLAAYFLFVEILFLIGAHLNGLITRAILITAVFSTIPLILGIWIGSRLFSTLPEATLKRMVLIALIALSLLGIFKTILQ